MNPINVSNTGTLYDQGLRHFHINTEDIFTIAEGPVRFIGFTFNQEDGVNVFATIYNGMGTNGEVVADVSVQSGATRLAKSRKFDVVLSGGLTIETMGGAPDLTIMYK